ncbi:DUF4097 domain-containing protein [Candidatus Gracilibacteria bacterium]|nr:DUF4097 domain-containing protein [Candidatus Gracilibacteria bacterium]
MAELKTVAPPETPQGADMRMTGLPDEPYYQRPDQARRTGFLLLVVGLIWLVFELTTRGSLLGGGLGFVERSAAVAPQEFSGQSLIVNVGADDVELSRWDGDSIRVEATKYGYGWNGAIADQQLEELSVDITQRGDSVQVEVLRPSGWSIFGRSPYVELRIAVPAGLDLTVNTISGDLRAEGVQGDGTLATVSGELIANGVAGDLRLRNTSGDILIDNYRGLLDAESVSGNIVVDTAEAERVRLSTVSGDIAVTAIGGDLELTSISGDIELNEIRDAQFRLNSTSGDVEVSGSLAEAGSNRIESVSGDIAVTLSEIDHLRLDMTTLSGELDSDLELQNETQERRQLSGQLGDGSITLSVSTTSGDATVN